MTQIINLFRLAGLFSIMWFTQTTMAQRPENPNTEIRYYGTGCFTIQRGESVLFTDPFISNPSTARLLFSTVKTDVDYVEQYINPATFAKVKMTIAGHAHYDHLLDYPYLTKYLPENSPLVTNKTAKHILAYYNLKQPVLVANEFVGTATEMGKWFYSVDSTMRVMPLKSMHPPHFAGINMMNKKYSEDLKSEPLLMGDWQEGKTLAFIVDWLDGETIEYRIYFSSSLAKAPFGQFPRELLVEKPIDDLFISSVLMSDFNEAPKPIIDLARPKRIILMHWENFLKSKEKSIKPMKKKELKTLLTKLKATYPNIEIVKPEPLNYY